MTRVTTKELMHDHITPRQAYILAILHTHGRGMTLNELAWQTDRKINTLSANMKKMEKYGLVKRIQETPNSTQLKFELTEKGLHIRLKINDGKTTKTIMSVLTYEELNQLILMLEKVTEAAETYRAINPES
jgi:DNA-binding MarR family transcriptional regulator